jgi:hypothetical protein
VQKTHVDEDGRHQPPDFTPPDVVQRRSRVFDDFLSSDAFEGRRSHLKSRSDVVVFAEPAEQRDEEAQSDQHKRHRHLQPRRPLPAFAQVNILFGGSEDGLQLGVALCAGGVGRRRVPRIAWRRTESGQLAASPLQLVFIEQPDVPRAVVAGDLRVELEREQVVGEGLGLLFAAQCADTPHGGEFWKAESRKCSNVQMSNACVRDSIPTFDIWTFACVRK